MLNWTTRKGDIIENSPNEKIYFFKKAYEELTTPKTSDLSIDDINLEEEKLNVSHEAIISTLIRQRTVNSNRRNTNLLVDTKQLINDLRLDAVKYKNGQPFVDICVILKQLDEAKKFASQNNISYDILDLIEKHPDNLKQKLKQECCSIMMENNDKDAAFLTMIVFKCFDATKDDLSVHLTELWSSGYHWDSYCLANILQVDPALVARFEAKLETRLPKKGKAPTASIRYAPDLLSTMDCIQLYRLLKIEIISTETSTLSDISKMGKRLDLAKNVFPLILASLLDDNSTLPSAIIDDLFSTIKKYALSALPVYLKGVDFELFKIIIQMFTNAYYELKHYKDKAVCSILQNLWKQKFTDFFLPHNNAVRNLFTDVCERFNNEADYLSFSAEKLNLKLAISLASLFVSNSDDLKNGAHKLVEQLKLNAVEKANCMSILMNDAVNGKANDMLSIPIDRQATSIVTSNSNQHSAGAPVSQQIQNGVQFLEKCKVKKTEDICAEASNQPNLLEQILKHTNENGLKENGIYTKTGNSQTDDCFKDNSSDAQVTYKPLQSATNTSGNLSFTYGGFDEVEPSTEFGSFKPQAPPAHNGSTRGNYRGNNRGSYNGRGGGSNYRR